MASVKNWCKQEYICFKSSQMFMQVQYYQIAQSDFFAFVLAYRKDRDKTLFLTRMNKKQRGTCLMPMFPSLQVSLSSLNRHAVATRADVGLPKATVLKVHLVSILNRVTIHHKCHLIFLDDTTRASRKSHCILWQADLNNYSTICTIVAGWLEQLE